MSKLLRKKTSLFVGFVFFSEKNLILFGLKITFSFADLLILRISGHTYFYFKLQKMVLSNN